MSRQQLELPIETSDLCPICGKPRDPAVTLEKVVAYLMGKVLELRSLAARRGGGIEV